jgi:hypothetical protein
MFVSSCKKYTAFPALWKAAVRRKFQCFRADESVGLYEALLHCAGCGEGAFAAWIQKKGESV